VPSKQSGFAFFLEGKSTDIFGLLESRPGVQLAKAYKIVIAPYRNLRQLKLIYIDRRMNNDLYIHRGLECSILKLNCILLISTRSSMVHI
jgi:hypothetical protein